MQSIQFSQLNRNDRKQNESTQIIIPSMLLLMRDCRLTFLACKMSSVIVEWLRTDSADRCKSTCSILATIQIDLILAKSNLSELAH